MKAGIIDGCFLCLGLAVGVVIVLWISLLNLNAIFQEYRSACFEYQEACNETIAFYENYSSFLHNLTEILIAKNIETQKNLTEIQTKYNYLKESYIQLSEENSRLREENENLKAQKGLVNPSYGQLLNFIVRDDTDEQEWSEDFDCTEFSNRFIRNFAREGYFACTTEITFEDDKGHIIVAVNTTDKGLRYVEPQDDRIIEPARLKIGENYCDIVGWRCDWNDTIKKISSCFELKI